MRTIESLIQAARDEAARADFPVDTPVYERAKKSPIDPILFAGPLDAPVAFFGRDLGKDEVAAGEPLIGAGGRLVREGIARSRPGGSAAAAGGLPALMLLTNTVPYKPPGNKAYSNPVKERFRPFVAELLADHWSGRRIITLGTEAFLWFAPYAEKGAAEAFWKREDRYEAEFACAIEVDTPDGSIRKEVSVGPLPHPSPLNQRWYGLFPGLLDARLAGPG